MLGMPRGGQSELATSEPVAKYPSQAWAHSRRRTYSIKRHLLVLVLWAGLQVKLVANLPASAKIFIDQMDISGFSKLASVDDIPSMAAVIGSLLLPLIALSLTALSFARTYLPALGRALFKKRADTRATETSEAPVELCNGEYSDVVTDEDLLNFQRVLDGSGDPTPWEPMMHKQNDKMEYRSYRRDPADGGPTQYTTVLVHQNADAEMVRDFYWDDDFRFQWDRMLQSSRVLGTCSETGTQLVHWVRKFPAFCSPRDYVIGRRMWAVQEPSQGGAPPSTTYYAVTKGHHHPEAPEVNRPRRVTNYLSCWRIRPVAGVDGTPNGAVETAFFHSEDMHIQRHVAKMGVRSFMWGLVKNIDPGVRQYMQERRERDMREAFRVRISSRRSSDLLSAMAGASPTPSGSAPVPALSPIATQAGPLAAGPPSPAVSETSGMMRSASQGVLGALPATALPRKGGKLRHAARLVLGAGLAAAVGGAEVGIAGALVVGSLRMLRNNRR
eukprot:jgi/Mesvir1/25034/Mv16973-RA.1